MSVAAVPPGLCRPKRSTLHPPAFTPDDIVYDFEAYALSRGIPETEDPLPYRKAGSVFATGDEAVPTMTSAKNDPRLRTVVCRHWLRDLCMKGNACEFLHQFDLSKMPLCRHGDRCKLKDCPFRHISEADRLECVFYSQGFCIHGNFCRYKHIRRPRSELPRVADFTLGLSQMQAGKDGVQQRRPAPKPNEFYKVSLCKHFAQGDCPFGDACHFAHGEQELKKFPRGGGPGGEVGERELHDGMFGDGGAGGAGSRDYFQGGTAGGGRPPPVAEGEAAHAAFFIARAATQHDLARSAAEGTWFLQARHAEALRRATAGRPHRPVVLFFTASGSDHVQGAALATSPAVFDDLAAEIYADGFHHQISVDWYRTVELPVARAVEAAPDLLLPTAETQLCQDMTAATGTALMGAVWGSPLATLYEPFDGTEPPPGTSHAAPDPARPVWPIAPGPAFIFGCNSQTMDECLGRGIFGLPAHMKRAASSIRPGSTVFLFNVTDRLLFGTFEAVTAAEMNVEPTAFSKNPAATSSPFPVQVRVRVSLECPPLEDSDPALGQILRGRGGGGRIGPVTHAQAEAIASLLALQCGALDYMADYQKAKKEGRGVRPPPIAVPPKIPGQRGGRK